MMTRRRRPPGSESAGYHYDASIRGYHPKTPTVAPSRSEAARGPAGDYAGAGGEYQVAAEALPPAAKAVTKQATAAATRRRRRQRRSARRVRRIQRQVSREERRSRAAALASVSKQRAERQRRRDRAPRPHELDRGKPDTFAGRPTAGTPTRAELRHAQHAGTLRVNRKGFVTTPAVRSAGRELAAAKASAARAGGARDLPHLDPEGDRVARRVLSIGKRQGASRKELLAAAETGLVESSGFHNLPGGDADSAGWRQERASLYPEPTNVGRGARNFFAEAKQQSGDTAGELAANIQRPAAQYRGRYDEAKPQAAAILAAFERGGLNAKQRRRISSARARARRVGLKAADTPAGRPPRKLVKRVVVAERAMREIEGEPYVWGGGHGSFGEYGKDCSGAVSYVLHKLKATNTPLTSGAMGSVLAPGPGALTVYYNANHTFLSYVNRHGKTIYWGTSVGDSGAGGLGPHDAPNRAYLAQYSVGHVPGMGRKQALQLGVAPAALTGPTPTAFPGMTFSADRTAATIEPGAGTVKKGKPGPSRRPIRLTPMQRYNRNKRKLKAIGAPLRTSTAGKQESHPILEELKEKYGSAPPSASERREAALTAATAAAVI